MPLYFACWIGFLLLMKRLLLAEYDIAFYGWSAALVGVLVLSKVVLALERVPLGGWATTRPAWVEVVLRTALYATGVLVVLAVEHGIRGAQEHGGFWRAVTAAFAGADRHHVRANALCVGGALLGYNAFAVIRHRVGDGALLRMFLEPRPGASRGQAAREPP